jgi:hypothetical protein
MFVKVWGVRVTWSCKVVYQSNQAWLNFESHFQSQSSWISKLLRNPCFVSLLLSLFYDCLLSFIVVVNGCRLPAPRPLSWGFSVWTVLKNAVGRDLSHITMPATINEPLSVLQKCAEELQFRWVRSYLTADSHFFLILSLTGEVLWKKFDSFLTRD